MQIIITKNIPLNESEWNSMCKRQNNFVQSTLNDKAQAFYNQLPIYFNLVNESNTLLAGVKFYFSENRRKILRPLTIELLQFGEFVFDVNEHVESYKLHLEKELVNFLKKEKIVKYTCGNFYGNQNLLLKLNEKYNGSKSTAEFNVARVDLRQEHLLASFNRNTRRNILKAEEANLKNQFEDNDIKEFLPFLKDVYIQQNNVAGCPNLEYIRHIHNSVETNTSLTFCHADRELLSTVLCFNYGKMSYSLFGGTLKNDFGSGQFMYYSLMKKLQSEGYDYFCFGQIAKQGDESNKKFSVGITTFKRGFNCEEIPAEKNIYILKPFKAWCWKQLVKLYIRK